MELLVSFRIDCPEDVEDDEFLQWLKFELGVCAVLGKDNPMEFAELAGEITPDSVQFYDPHKTIIMHSASCPQCHGKKNLAVTVPSLGGIEHGRVRQVYPCAVCGGTGVKG